MNVQMFSNVFSISSELCSEKIYPINDGLELKTLAVEEYLWLK